MIEKMKSIVTGYNGFIGSALTAQLILNGHDVILTEDNKDLPERGHFDYFFYFGSPSSNILYNDNPHKAIKETIENFIYICQYCKEKHIKLIFPSSATIYNCNNNYAHTKAALEHIVEAFGIDHLALRIFAGYGVGEEHKKDYASVIYQWCKGMLKGESPVIFGDGKQTRDFVYIDDIVSTIIKNIDKSGVIDIGTGVNTSFTQIVEIINSFLDSPVAPKYVYSAKPKNYVESTICVRPLSRSVSIEKGIEKIIKKMRQ